MSAGYVVLISSSEGIPPQWPYRRVTVSLRKTPLHLPLPLSSFLYSLYSRIRGHGFIQGSLFTTLVHLLIVSNMNSLFGPISIALWLNKASQKEDNALFQQYITELIEHIWCGVRCGHSQSLAAPNINRFHSSKSNTIIGSWILPYAWQHL